jgi:hypothetical protein
MLQDIARKVVIRPNSPKTKTLGFSSVWPAPLVAETVHRNGRSMASYSPEWRDGVKMNGCAMHGFTGSDE